MTSQRRAVGLPGKWNAGIRRHKVDHGSPSWSPTPGPDTDYRGHMPAKLALLQQSRPNLQGEQADGSLRRPPRPCLASRKRLAPWLACAGPGSRWAGLGQFTATAARWQQQRPRLRTCGPAWSGRLRCPVSAARHCPARQARQQEPKRKQDAAGSAGCLQPAPAAVPQQAHITRICAHHERRRDLLSAALNGGSRSG